MCQVDSVASLDAGLSSNAVGPTAQCVFIRQGRDRRSASSLRASLCPYSGCCDYWTESGSIGGQTHCPLEVSTVRPTDHGPGHFFACLKGTIQLSPTSPNTAADGSAREPSNQPPSPSTVPRVIFLSVFFDNDVYKGARQSVIMDACETQQFAPVDLSPLPAPPKSPSKRK